MIPMKIEVKDRGATPRGMRRVMNNIMKECWKETGLMFHREMMDERFTHRHATKAGYLPRSRNYERKKLREKQHTNPLEYSGTTRRLSRNVNVVEFKNGADVRYPDARALNFRNPKSQINMVQEFTKVLPEEANALASFFDRTLDRKLNAYNGAN